MQKTNQAYVHVAQAYIHTPCMQIVEPWAGAIWFVFCIRLNIFTSNISDLLLFLGLMGTGVVNLDIPLNEQKNKYNQGHVCFICIDSHFVLGKGLY